MQDRSEDYSQMLGVFAIVVFMALVGAGIAYEGVLHKAPQKAQLTAANWNP